MLRAPYFLLTLAASGCVQSAMVDRDAACRYLRESRGQIERASLRELAELAGNTPAASDAHSAYAQQVSAGVLGGVAAAALVAGLVTGFIVDTGTQPAARSAAYGLGGGAIASIAVALLLSYTIGVTARRARLVLRTWVDRCQESVASDQSLPVTNTTLP